MRVFGEPILDAKDGRAQTQRLESIVIAFDLVAKLKLVCILKVVVLLSKWMPGALCHIESEQSSTWRVLRNVLVLVVFYVNFLNHAAS